MFSGGYKCLIINNVLNCYYEDPGIKDYKFFCFNGKVQCFKIDFGRYTKHRANYYSPSGELLPFGEMSCPPDFDKNLEIPNNIEKMVSIAERLSEGLKFLRVDLYNVNGTLYFGELTFYPASGFGKFTSNEWDLQLGNLLKL